MALYVIKLKPAITPDPNNSGRGSDSAMPHRGLAGRASKTISRASVAGGLGRRGNIFIASRPSPNFAANLTLSNLEFDTGEVMVPLVNLSSVAESVRDLSPLQEVVVAVEPTIKFDYKSMMAFSQSIKSDYK
jgi:hypothetical protein